MSQDVPMGCCALDKSQTGASAMDRPCCTLLASMLKYSEMDSRPSGSAALGLNSGYLGAAKTGALSADMRRREKCIFGGEDEGEMVRNNKKEKKKKDKSSYEKSPPRLDIGEKRKRR